MSNKHHSHIGSENQATIYSQGSAAWRRQTFVNTNHYSHIKLKVF